MPLLSKARLMPGGGASGVDAKTFVYKEVESPNPDGSIPVAAGVEFLWREQPDETTARPGVPADGLKFTEDDVRERERAAWQRGFDEAAARSKDNLEKSLARERANVAAALCEFADGRDTYYHRMEGEVVRLVLSIARNVLHREAQVDPMLLTGVVRVALEKISGGTTVKLRVPVNQVDLWRAAISSLPARDLAVDVVGDESLAGPHCLIVTEMGMTDVSLDAQLGEIERGFLDMLTENPANGAANGRTASLVAS